MPSGPIFNNTLSSPLPDLLGFGWLAKGSVFRGRQETYAEYYAPLAIAEERAYSVWLSQGSCQVEEFCEGRSLGVGDGPNLREAFTRLPSLRSPLEHPRLAGVFTRLLRSGLNLRLFLPPETGAIYFPAGLIFSLHLPILAANRNAWEALKARDAQDPEQSRLHFVDHRNGGFRERPPQGKRVGTPGEVIELAALMVELEQICQILAEARVLPPGGARPLLVTLCLIQPRADSHPRP